MLLFKKKKDGLGFFTKQSASVEGPQPPHKPQSVCGNVTNCNFVREYDERHL